MKITGVVSEFNPFHKGHEYLLSELRARGAELIICVMSGSFVQRGEAAIADKYTRAAMAVRSGANIVLELPFPYCMASAEYFAKAGVGILEAVGANTLGFGSECADKEQLICAATVLAGEQFKAEYRRLCRSGTGSATAYFAAYRSITGADMPSGSNDILALEYIKAALRSDGGPGFDVVRRSGSTYGSTELDCGALPSAAALRKSILKNGIDSVNGYIPDAAYEMLLSAAGEGSAPADIRNAERAVLACLRLSDTDSLLDNAETDDGLGTRLKKSALQAADWNELISLASAKNYTDSHIRRAALFSLFGVSHAALKRPAAYTLLLAADRRGVEFLASVRGKTRIAVVTKPADAKNVNGAAAQAELSERADAIWALTTDKPLPAGWLLRKKPVII